MFNGNWCWIYCGICACNKWKFTRSLLGTNSFGQNILWAHILDSLALYSPLISIMDNGQRVSKMCTLQNSNIQENYIQAKREGVKNVPPPSLRKDINFIHPKTRARFTDFCCCGNKFTDGCRKHLFDTIPNNLPAIKKTFHQGCTGQGILLTCWAKSCGAGQGKCTHRADNFRLLWGRAPCFFLLCGAEWASIYLLQGNQHLQYSCCLSLTSEYFYTYSFQLYFAI